MNIADFYNMSEKNSTSVVDAVGIYPPNSDFISPEINNINLEEEKITFNINARQDNLEEYDYVKFICLTDADLRNLQETNFPSSTTAKTQEFIFGINKGDVVKKPDQLVNQISVPLKETVDGQYKFLIVFGFNSIDDGLVYLLTISPSDFVKTTINDFLKNEFAKPSIRKDPPIIDRIEDETFTSNLLYTCDKNGSFGAFYSLDAQKLILKFGKFPGFLNPNDNQQFNKFLYKTEFNLYKYSNINYGYEFDRGDLKVAPQIVNNLFIQNSSGKLFYQLFIPSIAKTNRYQAMLKFYFNDITIGIASQKLSELIRTKKNNNRALAKQIIENFYFEEIPFEFIDNYVNLNKLSDIDYKDFIDKVIIDFSKQVENSKEKTVSNQEPSSTYTTPHFSVSNSYQIFLKQGFQETIHIKSKKQNVFFPLVETTPFKTIVVSSAQEGSKNYVATNIKSFKNIKNLASISKFKITSLKDILVSDSGLENKSDCSDEDFKKDVLLQTVETTQFLNLSTVKEEKISFSYLRSIGNSVSALLFEKANGETFDFIPTGQAVLARLDNYDEYYDSYFFIVNDGET